MDESTSDHAHLAATLARGFNEDFGFPNSAKLAVQPASLLRGDEATLMMTIGALEAIRTGRAPSPSRAALRNSDRRSALSSAHNPRQLGLVAQVFCVE